MQVKSSHKNLLKKILKYVFFLSIAIFLLFLSFKNVSWKDLWEGLCVANYWWIGVSLLAGFFTFLVRARRWQFIIEPTGYNPSFKHTYDAVVITYLANFAMPRLGELARCGTLHKTEKIPFDSLLGTVILERIFDFLCMLLIAVFVFFFRLKTFGEFLSNNLWHPLFKFMNSHISIWFIAMIMIAVTCILLWCLRKRLAKTHIVQKINRLADGLIIGLKSGFRLQHRRQFFFYTFLLWFLYWLQGYTTMLALPETATLGIIDALFLLVVGSLAMVMPVQGGLGAYHLLISLALMVLYGIPETKGVVFATISHETQAIMMIILGFIALSSVLLTGKRKNTIITATNETKSPPTE